MKTPSSDLFLLIRTLTPAEKRYFRLFAVRHSVEERNSYLRLFDAIAAQEQYDEAALKAGLAGDAIAEHFAVTKRYLHQQLLESLHLFHSAQSVEESIRKDLHLASVLMQKDLPEQSARLLQKARKQIVRYELLSQMPELLQLERLAQDRLRSAAAGGIVNWKAETDDALSLLANEAAFSALSALIGYWHLRKVSPQDDAPAIYLRDNRLWPLLSGDTPPRTLRARLDYYKALSTWHFMRNEPQEAYRLNREHLALFEQHPQLLRLYPRRYLGALNNLLIDQFQLRLFEDLAPGLAKLKSLPQRPEFSRIPHIEEKVFEQSALLELNTLMAREQFEAALKILPAIEAGIQRLGAGIAENNLLSIQYLIAYLYFENGRFETASDWLNRLLQYPRRNVMEELFRFAGILNLLIHFELGNEDLLPYLIQSAKRQSALSGKRYQAEALCFKFLHQLLRTPGARRRQKLFGQWRDALLPLREQPAEQRAFNYVGFLRWLERKARG